MDSYTVNPYTDTCIATNMLNNRLTSHGWLGEIWIRFHDPVNLAVVVQDIELAMRLMSGLFIAIIPVCLVDKVQKFRILFNYWK